MPVGSGADRPRSGWAVGQRRYSPVRSRQQREGWMAPGQPDQQLPGVADHPSGQIDQSKAHRLEPLVHPLTAQGQLLDRRVQVERQRRYRPPGRVAPNCPDGSLPPAKSSFSTPCTSSPFPHLSRYHRVGLVTIPRILYQPRSGISRRNRPGHPPWQRRPPQRLPDRYETRHSWIQLSGKVHLGPLLVVPSGATGATDFGCTLHQAITPNGRSTATTQLGTPPCPAAALRRWALPDVSGMDPPG